MNIDKMEEEALYIFDKFDENGDPVYRKIKKLRRYIDDDELYLKKPKKQHKPMSEETRKRMSEARLKYLARLKEAKLWEDDHKNCFESNEAG